MLILCRCNKYCCHRHRVTCAVVAQTIQEICSGFLMAQVSMAGILYLYLKQEIFLPIWKCNDRSKLRFLRLIMAAKGTTTNLVTVTHYVDGNQTGQEFS